MSFMPFENEELISFLFFHDEVLSTNDGKEVFTWRYLHADDLIWLTGFSFEKTDWNCWDFFECLGIIDINLIYLCHDKSIMVSQFNTDWSFQILWNNRNSEIVFILSSVDVKTSLVYFVSNTVFNLRTKHHLIATHEVKHYVFKSWLKCFRINKIKVNLIISSNLNSLISFNKEDETSSIQHIVLFPFLDVFIIFINNLLEEENLTGTSGDQGSAVDEEHLAEIEVSHLFELHVQGVAGIDVYCLALSVEWVDYVVNVIVKRFIWKVLLSTFHNLTIYLFILNISVYDIVEKVIMRQRIIIK